MINKYFNKILTSILFIVIIVFFTMFINIYASSNNLFNDYKIKIIGNTYIKNKEIKNKIPKELSSSILKVNIKTIKKILEEINYIHSIQISRLLPESLIINVIERSPIMLLNKDDESIFIDNDGILLPVDKTSITTFPVPVISIKDDNIYILEHKDKITNIMNHLLNNYPYFYENLSEIIIDTDRWKFRNDNKTEFYTNNDNVIEQLIILKNFEEAIYPSKKFNNYSYIDLRIKNKIIVKEKYRKG